MATRMLIDATHEEETRVVVVKGNRVEEFDFETAARRPLKGNIYLARVTRVEPSLQAAFVDFGGNRHGFLAFSEIHPDYYQIPVADRERLKQEEAEAAAADEDEDDDEEEEEETSDTDGAAKGRRRRASGGDAPDPDREAGADEGPAANPAEAAGGETGDREADDTGPEVAAGPDAYADLSTDRPASDTPASDPLPAAALPERSGLRRVARLFGFGGDEDQQGHDQQGHGGGWQQAPAAAPVGDDDSSAGSDDLAAAHGGQENDAEADGEPRQDGTADAGAEAAGSAADAAGEDGTREPQAHMLAEVDDEDRPAEERDDQVEAFGGDAVDEVRRRSSKRRPLTRRYKIQEVIKRRQILLVQVVKEERGNKGAALTTYMSLAGRYCVLMPNSPNGGGISRKIVSATDRKRLKGITGELDVPEGMGMIVRTAGMERTRAEIKRDFEFLLRTWDNIRELTLASMAPCLVYEEANLIKRAIRDVYNKDVDEVLVEGDNGYRHAKDFMKMLMPSHSKRVQPYKDRIPLFHRYQVENQLDEMFYPTVQLKSGGYIVINATEALVAIDVNSGRSTKEHNIEGTAYKTNMEAAEEVARQLRLRDMAGLIVIDFIDMDDGRNARNVERKLKECLKLDRARIQVGRISSFGLLEMSRQRLRPSLVEQSMVVCPHCDGQGHVRSVESAAIRAIRAAEDEGIRERSAEVTLIVPTTVAIYLLNSKRDVLQEIEGRYGIRVLVKNDDELGPSEFNLERSKTRSDGEPPVQKVITAESVPYRGEDDEEDESDNEVEADAEVEVVAEEETDTAEAAEGDDDDSHSKGDKRGKRRRRRRRRGGDEAGEEARSAGDGDVESSEQEPAVAASGEDADGEDEEDGDAASGGQEAAGDDDGQSGRRGRRRGRRGGRRRRRRQDREDGTDQVAASGEDDDGDAASDEDSSSEEAGERQADANAAATASGLTDEDDPGRPPEAAAPAAEQVDAAAEPAAGPVADSAPDRLSEDRDGSDRGEAGDTPEPEVATAPDAAPASAVEEAPAGEVRADPDDTGVIEAAEAAIEETPDRHSAMADAGTGSASTGSASTGLDSTGEAEATETEAGETAVGATAAGEAEADTGQGDTDEPESPAAAADTPPAGQAVATTEEVAAAEPAPVAEEDGGPADRQDDAPSAQAEEQAAPTQEPATGAVLSPEEYAAAAGSEASAGPRRGWWRRSARQDHGEGGNAGTGQD